MWSIFVIWLVSAVTCVAITWRAKRAISWCQLCSLHKDERGGAYTLSYVMVIPIYLIAFCFVVETTFMLIAKLGTNYASFAAARTAIVWLPFGGDDKIDAAANKPSFPLLVDYDQLLRRPIQKASSSTLKRIRSTAPRSVHLATTHDLLAASTTTLMLQSAHPRRRSITKRNGTRTLRLRSLTNSPSRYQ